MEKHLSFRKAHQLSSYLPLRCTFSRSHSLEAVQHNSLQVLLTIHLKNLWHDGSRLLNMEEPIISTRHSVPCHSALVTGLLSCSSKISWCFAHQKASFLLSITGLKEQWRYKQGGKSHVNKLSKNMPNFLQRVSFCTVGQEVVWQKERFENKQNSPCFSAIIFYNIVSSSLPWPDLVMCLGHAKEKYTLAERDTNASTDLPHLD